MIDVKTKLALSVEEYLLLIISMFGMEIAPYIQAAISECNQKTFCFIFVSVCFFVLQFLKSLLR